MAYCSCREAYHFRELKRILSKEIKWYKENINDEGLLYDESIDQLNNLKRGAAQDILKILSEEHLLRM